MAQDSGNTGTWLGVGGLLIALFGIMGALYWFLFRGKKEKGSAAGANKTSKSKLGGKSK